jgi:hypothetical protein
VPDGDAVEMFDRYSDDILDAALTALGRDMEQALVVVSENDLD